ncbi:HAD family hydrolase [Phenylobacterium terrae]|uniref:HAD family hydrolase n=1 Tax=Phenylobacterium terrae TaxID=2665495 RepID=A0ABW4N5Q7_9CAUL
MSLPRAPRAVVFDMDGLLFDTEALYQQAYFEAAELGGFEVSPEAIRLAIGMPWVRGRELMLGALGEQFPIDDYYARMTDRFLELSATDLRLKPGVVELLDVLDRLKLPRCIATSSAQSTVRDHLSAHNLIDRFHAVIGHGDYENSKPAPDPFLLAAKRLGVPASFCLALEDSHNGVRSASAAGMMTIMVPDLVPPTKEIAKLCHSVVESLHQVAALVMQAWGPNAE